MFNTLAFGCLALLAQGQGMDLKNGDMVALVGATMVELEQITGYWETEITRRTPGTKVRFRNLGWSGDTVFGQSRSGFGSVADGYKKLQENIKAVQPTVTLFAYGQNESFDSEDGIGAFRSGYERLLRETGAYRGRTALITPWRQEKLGGPFPDPARHNQDIGQYAARIIELAQVNQCSVLDLFAISNAKSGNGSAPYTDNTLHFTPQGYWKSSADFAGLFKLPADDWSLNVDAIGIDNKARGCAVKPPVKGGLSWKVLDNMLPMASAPQGGPAGRKVGIQGLKAGNYALTIDGVEVARGSSREWSQGVVVRSGPDYSQVEALRKLIQEKNRQFFHRWRPQNETYLFGFRKHEQGQNAREIPQFDAIIASKEEEIFKMKQPVERTYLWTEIR